jgi:hypothetical protein
VSNSYGNESKEELCVILDKEKLFPEEKLIWLNVKICNRRYQAWITESYTNLLSQIKLSFLSETRVIVKLVLSIVARNNVYELFENLCHEGESKHNLVSDGNSVKIMRGVTSAYNNADDWTTQEAVLRAIAPNISWVDVSIIFIRNPHPHPQ